MLARGIKLAREIDRVPSTVVALDAQQEWCFQRLMEQIVMVDVHEHPMVLPEDMEQLPDYLRTNDYRWGYQAVKQGGWAAVATANFFRGLANTPDLSMMEFEDVLQEVGLMLSDLSKQTDVLKVGNADDIEAVKQRGIIGFLPTLEHLAIGKELNRLDILHGIGIRLAGLTYNRKNYIGDGQFERNDGGLSDFGIAVVQRMNDLGMAIDLSHASFRTAMDAIHFSRAPVAFSHNAAFSIRPVPRCRNDEELTACAQKGGLIAITAVPNSLSDDPEQDIECVLDHYDYMVNLVGIDYVGIGT
ncbi:MAG TPA: membrane dipeptidase, partial [Dehalococcoidia bacterium]|nr:membrane dipeptidase [Dehalococcoidia bacterium]